MLLTIDPHSDEPIYQQIRNQIILGIARHEVAQDEVLPSVRQLADEIGVNMMTVSKAYTQLKQEGYIVTDRRQGTKIASLPISDDRFLPNFEEKLSLLLAEAVIHSQSKEVILKQVEEIISTFEQEEEK
ncbi:GntR family transcriptional regulator [Enterococcus sp. JM4C]|uniref:GntR family transcriptional regulator n=1 Tax=Candidatus Enterococcus huntleyi TaxID=1857217 RepID=UPI00137A0278|nr:GntR family transcriptional regulator [Enterococcus sp. JM4C]KAF1296133.1 GntR family transcriptional regulator [Enterococcus sp. JM4C]